jgi:hypothetical protein
MQALEVVTSHMTYFKGVGSNGDKVGKAENFSA